MNKRGIRRAVLHVATIATLGLVGGTAPAVDNAGASIEGRVLAGGAPVAGSAVTVWRTSAQGPQKLAEARTSDDGHFRAPARVSSDADSIVYVVAEGGRAAEGSGRGENRATALLSVLGSRPPARVTVNELTTVASVWTSAQFLEGTALRGAPLSLRIAAENVPNFVNLETGGLGATIQDALNSTQTPTMGNFATLGTLLAGCTTQAKEDACQKLFAAATPPDGRAPDNTLTVAESIAQNPSSNSDRIFALLDEFYPVPPGKTLRKTPYMPYLSEAPSSWVLALKFGGGGLNGPGKLVFDGQGNMWTGDNFIVGSQARDALWDGNVSKLAPDGRPLSPPTTGFTGGGVEGPGFGTAVAADDSVWVTSFYGKTISHFDNSGRPLSPPDGYTFGGQLGMMQGIITTPDGDVWALDLKNDQVVHLPKGDPDKVEFLCRASGGKPNKDSPCKLNAPFHLAIDQQDRIWITNAIGDTVTRLSAREPTKIDVLKSGGFGGKGMAIDTKGNAWVTNTFGDGLPATVKAKVVELKLTGQKKEIDKEIVDFMKTHRVGSVTMLQPDGHEAQGGSTYKAKDSMWTPWGVAIDGDDQVWISNLVGTSIVRLCGARTETCPPGMKTGDPISPPGGYVGGGMQWLTDVAIDPAGNVWVADNWQDSDSCYGKPPEAVSTRCGGNGVSVFYGMAKPVRTPLVGPPRLP
jgi:streptogramin lyase